MEIPKRREHKIDRRHTTITVDIELMKRAKEYDINLSAFFEQQLRLAIEQLDKEQKTLNASTSK